MDISEHEAHDIPDATDSHDGTVLGPIAKEMKRMQEWKTATDPDVKYNDGQGPTNRSSKDNTWMKTTR